MSPRALNDLAINNVFLILVGALSVVFLRNVYVSAIYIHTGKVNKKLLLYILFLSQLLGPIAIVAFIIPQFDSAAHCAVILRITTTASGISLSLLLTGILGVKVYRCLDNNRLVLATLAVLSTAATAVLILDVVNLRALRTPSGRCSRPSSGLSPIFVMILLTESFFICACFFYLFWKSHGPAVVQGRISVHLSSDEDIQSHPSVSRKETARNWRGRPPTSHFSTSHKLQHSPEPSITSRHDETQRIHTYNTLINAESTRDTKCPIPFPSIVHSRSPLRSGAVRMSTTTDSPHLPTRTPTCRPTSPVRSSMNHFTRYIPRMSLFREVMRHELCYTAIITALTVVPVVMSLVSVKNAGGIDTATWVTLDWALISLLIMHSFGRVIERHENESLLLHQSAWYHDLHTDRTTAELLGDAPQPMRTPRVLFKACGRRSATRYNINGGVSLSDLSGSRFFPLSTYSSRGDLESSAASTSGTSNTFPLVETESFTRTLTGGPREEHVRSSVSMEDLSMRSSRSRKPAERN